MRCKIAVVQFGVQDVSEKENMERAEGFIKRASVLDADVIVFPEDFVSRTTPDKMEFLDSEKNLNVFKKLAKKYKIDIIPGSMIIKKGSHLYNVSCYIDYKGKVLSEYKKVHLWSTEQRSLKPGKDISVFDTRYGRVGLIICWDAMFPEIFRKMMKKKVEIVFCPSYWCYEDAGKGVKYNKKSEEKLIDSLCVDRAFEEEIAFVFCNASGTNKISKKRESLVGHSQVTIPFKGIVKKFNHNKEGMFVAEIDPEIIKDAERAYGIKRELRKKN